MSCYLSHSYAVRNLILDEDISEIEREQIDDNQGELLDYS